MCFDWESFGDGEVGVGIRQCIVEWCKCIVIEGIQEYINVQIVWCVVFINCEWEDYGCIIIYIIQ